MSEKLSRSASVRELIAAVAGPRQWSDTRESWLHRAARRAGISFRQAKALFYGEITDVNHRSARLMRDAAENYGNLASQLRSMDPEFHRETIAAYVDLARAFRSMAGETAEEQGDAKDMEN